MNTKPRWLSLLRRIVGIVLVYVGGGTFLNFLFIYFTVPKALNGYACLAGLVAILVGFWIIPVASSRSEYKQAETFMKWSGSFFLTIGIAATAGIVVFTDKYNPIQGLQPLQFWLCVVLFVAIMDCLLALFVRMRQTQSSPFYKDDVAETT